ncbi:glycosyltransferase family 2 protein [Luteipulveratus mongoliensis]|uniref:Glycosyl transferase family 2 n=1 Tax=Luteipulveratus mongoliensis TaxID=571913 RepID=A0A0K1JGT2_9MICO|nr:glycosyltransferase family 2 protein [Luteipulveratus mongoliensis]AKU15924.1 glycosyl transferase family 2 [Luteipulveratus mongoliensis]
MTSRPEVTVVVVTYNSADLLPDLVASFPAGLEGVEARIVFVDNDSHDGSAEAAARLLPSAKVVETGRNGGYAAGINAGVAALGTADAVLILNADVRLGEGCVRELLRGLEVPGTGIAVPRLTNRHGELNHSMRREPGALRTLAETAVGARRLGRLWDVGEFVYDETRYDNEAITDWAEGSTQLISAECWAACGPWDESFFLYSEETEYGLRARDAGFVTRYVPTAHAVHLEGGSDSNPGMWALLSRNKVLLYRRRHGPVSSSMFYAFVVGREATRSALGHPTSRAALRMLLSRRRMREPAGPHSLRV